MAALVHITKTQIYECEKSSGQNENYNILQGWLSGIYTAVKLRVSSF